MWAVVGRLQESWLLSREEDSDDEKEECPRFIVHVTFVLFAIDPPKGPKHSLVVEVCRACRHAEIHSDSFSADCAVLKRSEARSDADEGQADGEGCEARVFSFNRDADDDDYEHSGHGEQCAEQKPFFRVVHKQVGFGVEVV